MVFKEIIKNQRANVHFFDIVLLFIFLPLSFFFHTFWYASLLFPSWSNCGFLIWFFSFFFWSWQVSNWVLNHMIEKFSLGGFVLKGNLQLTRLELLTLWLEASQIWSTHHFRWIWHGTTLIFCHGSVEFKTLLDDALSQGLTISTYTKDYHF